MESFSKILLESATNAINEFALILSNHPDCSMSHEQILDAWNEKSGDSLKINVIKAVASKAEPTTTKRKTSKAEVITKICIAELKGKNAGETCTKKVVAESKSGNYCGVHKKLEAAATATTATADATDEKEPAPKKAAKPAKAPPTKEIPVREVIKKIDEKKKIMVLNENQWNNHEHAESGIVFKQFDKVSKAYGKQLKDGTVAELSKEDIDYCKSMAWDYQLPSTIIETKKDKKEEEEDKKDSSSDESSSEDESSDDDDEVESSDEDSE